MVTVHVTTPALAEVEVAGAPVARIKEAEGAALDGNTTRLSTSQLTTEARDTTTVNTTIRRRIMIVMIVHSVMPKII